MAPEVEPTNEAQDVKEFISDELGLEVTDEFLEEEAAQDPKDYAGMVRPREVTEEDPLPAEEPIAEEEVPHEEELAAEPEQEPEGPSVEELSSQYFYKQRQQQKEQSQIDELKAEIARLQAQYQVPANQQGPQQPQQQVQQQPEDPEPDADEDPIAHLEWQNRQLSSKLNLVGNFIAMQAQQQMIARQHMAQQQAQQQAMTQYAQRISQQEEQWNQERPGYYDKANKVVQFLQGYEKAMGRNDQEAAQRVAYNVMNMMADAERSGMPGPAVVERAYEQMAATFGAQMTHPNPKSNQSGPFEAAQRAQKAGATGSLSSGAGGVADAFIDAARIREGDFSSGDAEKFLDKRGVDEYLENIRKSGIA